MLQEIGRSRETRTLIAALFKQPRNTLKCERSLRESELSRVALIRVFSPCFGPSVLHMFYASAVR